jgi:hypothetical protein
MTRRRRLKQAGEELLHIDLRMVTWRNKDSMHERELNLLKLNATTVMLCARERRGGKGGGGQGRFAAEQLRLPGKVADFVHGLLHRHLQPLQLSGDFGEARRLLGQRRQLLHLHEQR